MKTFLNASLCIVATMLIFHCAAMSVGAEPEPPVSAEVAEAIQPYLDGHKMTGIVALNADKRGKVHFKKLIGFADVEAGKPIRRLDSGPPQWKHCLRLMIMT